MSPIQALFGNELTETQERYVSGLLSKPILLKIKRLMEPPHYSSDLNKIQEVAGEVMSDVLSALGVP